MTLNTLKSDATMYHRICSIKRIITDYGPRSNTVRNWTVHSASAEIAIWDVCDDVFMHKRGTITPTKALNIVRALAIVSTVFFFGSSLLWFFVRRNVFISFIRINLLKHSNEPGRHAVYVDTKRKKPRQ